MYFNNDGKKISSIVSKHKDLFVAPLYDLHNDALVKTQNEVAYFRHFFPMVETYINSIRIPGLHFQCRTEETHSSPYVTFGTKKTCELGDYFFVVKYKKDGKLIGRKAIIYQFKRSHSTTWKIDQKQLHLLKEWPTFCFGKTMKGKTFYNLRPLTPEYGSFVLVGPHQQFSHLSNLYGNAYEVSENQTNNRIGANDRNKFIYSSIWSYFFLLTWKIGEPILDNTDISDFTSALYRYLKWDEDPPDEFSGNEKKSDATSFWGIELTISVGEPDTSQ